MKSALSRRALTAVAGALLGVAAPLVSGASAAHATGHGVGWYGIWGNNVTVRDGGYACHTYPAVGTCTSIKGYVNSWHNAFVWCQKAGQTVGGNPYWVYVTTDTNPQFGGFMASYYIENSSNWIDGVPPCE